MEAGRSACIACTEYCLPIVFRMFVTFQMNGRAYDSDKRSQNSNKQQRDANSGDCPASATSIVTGSIKPCNVLLLYGGISRTRLLPPVNFGCCHMYRTFVQLDMLLQ